MPYVYSTMSTDVAYVEYGKSASGNLPPVVRKITVRGGANVADKRFVTPRGVATLVSDDDLAFLVDNSTFQTHVAGGFISVEKSKTDPEIVAADMQQKDGSAPLVDADFTANGKPAPTTGEAR